MRLALAAVLAFAAAPAIAADWLIELKPRADLLDPTKWTATDNRAVERHFGQIQSMLASGRAVFAGRSMLKSATGRDDPAMFGIVVLTGVDRQAAEAVMRADAAVAAGVMTARLHPFYVVKPDAVRPEFRETK